MGNGLWNKVMCFMGLADIEDEEGNAPEEEIKHTVQGRRGNILDIRTASLIKMAIYQPVTFDQTTEICDNLKNRRPVVVNLEKLENEVARRILDFLSGAVYGLGGSLYKVSGGVFVAAPNNVEISENLKDGLEDKMIFKRQK